MQKPKVLLFDTFGTLTDWRGSITREGERLSRLKGLESVDWDKFAREWRAGYFPGMAPVIAGERPFTSIDVIHRERLDVILEDFDIGDAFDESERVNFNLIWHRLDPWPDVVPGMLELNRDYLLAPLSNGTIILLSSIAKRAGIPFDFIFSSDTFRAFKPDPAVYLGAINMLGLEPTEVMLVAAHNSDLKAAQSHGMQTAYVNRPTEFGVDQDKDFGPEGDWEYVTETVTELAGLL